MNKLKNVFETILSLIDFIGTLIIYELKAVLVKNLTLTKNVHKHKIIMFISY